MTKKSNQTKHPARFYKTLDKDRVHCFLCEHQCRISPDHKGVCGVRKNIKGKLYSLNYGKAIAAHIDPIEKKPLYHFLPGSRIFSVSAAGCNFRCDFCQNWQISQMTKGKNGKIIGDELPPEEIVKQARENNCSAVAYTYTEPTVFMEYALDTAKLAKQQDLKNVFVTNGFQTDEAIAEMVGLVDAANIDLKSFSDEYYRQVCGARLGPVLESIKKMHQEKIWIEVTTLIVPGQNDSDEELTQIAEFIAGVDKDIPWHISRFFPQYKMDKLQPTPSSTIEKAYDLGKKAGLNHIYAGNIDLPEYSHTYCSNGHKVIARQGYFVEFLLEKSQCPECGGQVAGVFD